MFFRPRSSRSPASAMCTRPRVLRRATEPRTAPGESARFYLALCRRSQPDLADSPLIHSARFELSCAVTIAILFGHITFERLPDGCQHGVVRGEHLMLSRGFCPPQDAQLERIRLQ